MDQARPEYKAGNEIEDTAEMMGWNNHPPRQVVTEISGYYPLFEALIVHYKDYTTAAVFGCMWRFMQMVDGVCKASLETIGEALEMDKSTVSRHIAKLVAEGFEFMTPAEFIDMFCRDNKCGPKTLVNRIEFTEVPE